jgi:hypothetical protein
MKKRLFTILAFFSLTTSFGQRVDFQEILRFINNGMQDKPLFVNNVSTDTLSLNSFSNSALLGGQNRKTIEIKLPPTTYRWFYRLTILDIKSNYSYRNDETLYYLMANNKYPTNLYTNNGRINVFFMGQSGDEYNFKQNRIFSHYNNYSVSNMNSFYGQNNLVNQNIWMGIENITSLQGLKVIVEIVALTTEDEKNLPKPAYQNINSIESEKKVNEAKVLFDLGVFTKKDYDSVVERYSLRLTKVEAIEKLKSAKNQLDKGEITQLEYDELKKRLTPIILNK